MVILAHDGILCASSFWNPLTDQAIIVPMALIRRCGRRPDASADNGTQGDGPAHRRPRGQSEPPTRERVTGGRCVN
jgi:hypothetical protein